MTDLSDDEMYFKNVYEGMPKDTEAGDDDVNSIEDIDDSDLYFMFTFFVALGAVGD